jgi:hypothetical protein
VLQAAYRAMAVAVAVPDGAYDAARCFAVAAARAGLVLLAATGGGGRCRGQGRQGHGFSR